MSTNYINKITDTAGTTHDIAEGVDTRIFRATCPTAAATAAKVATLDDATGFTLAAGVRVAVTFTYGNSAATPTLNVNSSGAKTIATPTSATSYTTGSGTVYNTWGAYETVVFTYNGTYWIKSSTGYQTYQAYARVVVDQTANTSNVWRKVLSTYNSAATAAGSITSGTDQVTYYDVDGPAINTSSGKVYAKGYDMLVETTDSLYTNIMNYGWDDCFV